VENQIGTARSNAKRIWDKRDTNGDNPSTQVFELINDLEKMAE